MKKLILLSFLVLGLIFASCSDKDDSSNPINPGNNSLEDMWHGEYALGSDTIRFTANVILQSEEGSLKGIGIVYASHTEYEGGMKKTEIFEMESALIGTYDDPNVTFNLTTNPLSKFSGQLWSDGNTITGTFTHLFTESDYEGEYALTLKRVN